jgi:hypothetical protein
MKNWAKGGAEKPVSLGGASFREVLAALLRTRPMPAKGDAKGDANEQKAN